MSEISITSSDFEEGGEIPKKCGYKFENKEPHQWIAMNFKERQHWH